MFISAAYIDIKLHQDYADFFIDEEDDLKGLIICDGIGEFKDSGTVARTVAELFIDKRILKTESLIHSIELKTLKEKGLTGGTTLISLVTDLKNHKTNIQYLGNGGIIQCRGDFAVNANSGISYRYSDIMIPHISPDGALTKHISNHSGKQELKASEIELKLTSEVGDILLLFSDGIGSLENNFILKDDEQRYWRYENTIIQIILESLDELLTKNYDDEKFEDQLALFNISILKQLKSEKRLEDDAALGILISPEVLYYYKSKING
tara:strand:- start:2326 stop:3123 length:798 start_codon:yes stop_codon:yes gene_type:complete